MKLLTVLITVVVFLTTLDVVAQIQHQEQGGWCWAACIQDVEQEAGLDEQQGDIVSRLYGSPQNRGATIDQVAALLRKVGLHGTYYQYPPQNPVQLSTAFATSWKIIALVDPSLGPAGHFIVLEAATPYGLVLVSDPFPPFSRWMPVAEVYQILIAEPVSSLSAQRPVSTAKVHKQFEFRSVQQTNC